MVLRRTAGEDVLFAEREKQNSRAFSLFTFFLSLSFFAAAPIAAWLSGVDSPAFWENLQRIMTGPARLVTDYFNLGCLASTLFNAGVCGSVCNLLILVTRTRATATTFAAYLLVVAHCFYGLNFLNMWPPFLGVITFCLVTRNPIRKNLHIAMFATALAPVISDLLFFYPIGTDFRVSTYGFSVVGVVLSVLFGLLAGFLIPALLPGTTAMHRGYNMYKAGLAIGIMGIFVYGFLYTTLGIQPTDAVVRDNGNVERVGGLYWSFMNCFFAVIFAGTLLLGNLMKGRSFKGYKKLLGCRGYGLDFADKFGMPLCLINFGIYGFCILLYLNLVMLLPILFPFLPQGGGMSGATVGVAFAALTFSADGQHPKNVAPIVVGYGLLFLGVCGICTLCSLPIPWTLSTQAYINGLAFATGLCPFAGKYGKGIGILAGLVSAGICTSTAAMHGGFVLYNGGFNAGLTALILLPILDFYRIRPRWEDDVAESGEEKPKK